MNSSSDKPRRFSYRWLRHLMLGNPIPNSESDEARLPKLLALPVFSSDAISSVAYATQEIVLALGAAGLAVSARQGVYAQYTWGVVSAIVLLLVIVAVSYRQTIFAYPSGGGSYIVSKENLGVNMGLVAAAALLIDYVLTVAVSIASGVQNLVGTPALHGLAGHVVLTCIAFVVFLTLAYLRGIKQAGALFAIPTYLFIVLAFGMIALGAFGPSLGWRLHPEAVNQDIPRLAASGARTIGILVILRAFANGCSAMTGTEAISNGIPAFQKPESKNAATTLLWMAGILAALFIGISYLATHLHVVYWEQNGKTAPAVIDQLSSAVFGRTGRGVYLYYAMQFATAAILIIAANTSFADFPRLASILAGDRFLPYDLAHRGDRLVFSDGIVLLGVFSALLLFLFKGDVDRLIPLYALGVFTAFTLSQSGMVRHWLRERGKGWHVKAAVNGLGAITTGLVFCVIIYEKAPQGAWVVVVAAGLLVWMFKVIHGHFERIIGTLKFRDDERPELGQPTSPPPQESTNTDAPPPKLVLRNQVIVLVNRPHRGVVPALRYAHLLAQDFEAVYVEIDPALTEMVKGEWQQFFPGVRLTVLESPYRSLVQPVRDYIAQKRGPAPAESNGSTLKPASEAANGSSVDLVTVVLPEYFTDDIWGFLLQNKAGSLLKVGLLHHDDVVLANVRYRVPSAQE